MALTDLVHSLLKPDTSIAVRNLPDAFVTNLRRKHPSSAQAERLSTVDTRVRA